MRILAISNLYPPHCLGGYEIRCQQVCKGLTARGHAIAVIASTQNCSAPTVEDQDGIAVHRTLELLAPFGQPVEGGRLSPRLRHIARKNHALTRQIIAETKPDLVFAWNQLRLTGGPVRAAREAGCPLAFSLGDENIMNWIPRPFSADPRQALAALLERTFYRRIMIPPGSFESVQCISEKVKHNLLAKGLPIEAARVIYRGIPLDMFPVKSEPGGVSAPIRMLYVGRLEDYKGVHTVFEALAQMDRGEQAAYRFTLAGDGGVEYRERLGRMAADLATQTVFLGQVEHGRLPEIYRENDLLLFPSIWDEPFGVTHLEAMASGTVVISTRGGGQDEFLEHGENAMVFEKEDAAGLAECLRWAAAQPEGMRRLARKARERVERDFTYDRYIDEMERFACDAARRAHP